MKQAWTLTGVAAAVLALAVAATRSPATEENPSGGQATVAAAPSKPAAPTKPLPPLPPGTDWAKIDWKSRLTAEQFRVTRRAGTERPFHNAFWDNQRAGEYRCVNCDLPLYKSDRKFDAHCGWPSFDKPIDEAAISEHEDRTLARSRTETRCARCGAHLGHVFDDGPTATGLRYCMNSAAMRFVPNAESTEKDVSEKKEAAPTQPD